MESYDEKMTLEEHIIESLPHLIGNVPIVRSVNISFDRIECENRFLYYYDINDGEYVLYISNSLIFQLRTIFNIDGKQIHDIISKYLNVTAITYDDHLCRMISNDWFRPSISNYPFSQVCGL